MPIVAVCPYCSAGRVKLPADDIGKSVTCPACGSEFAAIPTDEPAARSSAKAPAAVVATAEPPPKPKRTTLPDPEPLAGETLPDAPALPDAPEADNLPDPSRLPALTGVAAAAGGIAAWLIPDYGRLVWLALAVSGLLAAGVAWLASDRKKLFPWVATGVSAGSVLVCVLLPSLLGEGWWPNRGANANEAVAVGFDGEQQDANKPVDATKADWLRGGVRVSVIEVKRGPVEVTTGGKKPKKGPTKEDVLQVVIEVGNDGSAMPVKFAGWTDAKFNTAGDVTIPAKVFDDGVTPTHGPPAAQTLTTGTAARQTLLFEIPKADAGGRGTLELSAAGFGGAGDPVRLTVPLSNYTRNRGGAK